MRRAAITALSMAFVGYLSVSVRSAQHAAHMQLHALAQAHSTWRRGGRLAAMPEGQTICCLARAAAQFALACF